MKLKRNLFENFSGDFEMIGCMLICEIEQKTNIKLRNVDDFETKAIDVDSDSVDTVFTQWVYKLNKLEFNKVNRSQYGRGIDFEQDILEYIGNNYYIRRSGSCFTK